jgi:hypothetical protein
MSPRQIEAWAIRVIEQVENKQNIEDTLVELKHEWPAEPNKAARRIGGQANAARGEPVLWLIGIDEKAGMIVGAPFSEYANWYPTVEKEFDGIAPRCIPLNIRHKDGKVVVALLFETDRAPYVVRNPVHGQPNGGPVSFEVPWRNGSRIDSARRADLFKLLTPVAKLPEVEVLAAGLWAHEVKQPSAPSYIAWRLDVYLFISPRSEGRVVIPAHRCESSILPSEAGGYALPLSKFSFGSDTAGNIVSKSAITVNMPGLVTITANYLQNGYALPLESESVRVVGKARPIGADGSIDWSRELTRCFRERADYVGIWGIGPFTSF